MILSSIIIVCCFICTIALILTRKLNRAVAALAGALVTYFTLIFIEHVDNSIIIDFLFGTKENGYVNLHALVLIIGMFLIVQICHSAGVFQFIGFKLIQISKGRPIYLLILLACLAVFLSATLSNILAIIILIPLTIVSARILSIDPVPFIIVEAIMVNIGGLVFVISSIPNILIATHVNISFSEFFIKIGIFAPILFIVTFGYLYSFYRKTLVLPKKKFVKALQEFNVWNYVPNKRLFYKSFFVLFGVIICLIIIPSSVIPPDSITISGGVILIILSKLDGHVILKNLDLEIIFYLLGIFTITGAMEYLGVVEGIGFGLLSVIGNNPLVAILLILWISALLSGLVDNIPITKVFLPVVDVISAGFAPLEPHTFYYSLVYGINLGENMAPLGDNMVILTIAEENGHQISYSKFLRLTIIATILQLITLTIYFVSLYNPFIGLTILALIGLSFFVLNFIGYLRENVKKRTELLLWQTLKNIPLTTEHLFLSLIFYRTILKLKVILMKIMKIKKH